MIGFQLFMLRYRVLARAGLLTVLKWIAVYSERSSTDSLSGKGVHK